MGTKHLGPHQFKKGETGNPNGRPREPEELKFYRNNARNGMMTFFMKAVQQNLNELKAKSAKGGELLAYEAMAIKLITEAFSKGSPKHMELCMKLLKIDIDNKKPVTDEVSDDTGYEEIPTEKLIQIQSILSSD